MWLTEGDHEHDAKFSEGDHLATFTKTSDRNAVRAVIQLIPKIERDLCKLTKFH